MLCFSPILWPFALYLWALFDLDSVPLRTQFRALIWLYFGLQIGADLGTFHMANWIASTMQSLILVVLGYTFAFMVRI